MNTPTPPAPTDGPALGPATVQVGDPERGVRVLGTVDVQDLRSVLTHLQHQEGPHGPQSPMTQWMLREATRALGDNLAREMAALEGLSAPRILAAMVGHGPFVERTLGLGAHEMHRRWPVAVGWYHDLLSYIVRPERIDHWMGRIHGDLTNWLRFPYGQAVRILSHQQIVDAAHASRLALAVECLWPACGPVQEARARYCAAIRDYDPLLWEVAFATYGLALRPGVDMATFSWATSAITEHERRGVPLPVRGYARGRGTWEGAMLVSAGALVDAGTGADLTLDELHQRAPRLSREQSARLLADALARGEAGRTTAPPPATGEATVGERADVTLPTRGCEDHVIGRVEIEDLRPVLTHLHTRRGVDGPQSPMTQYLLREAASALEDNLFRELDALDGKVPPRILSAMVGHEGFVERTLGISPDQMQLRWPRAADWYSDLIAYILRQALVEQRAQRRPLPLALPQASLGELVEGQIRRRTRRWTPASQLAAMVQALWPSSPTVRAAHDLSAKDVAAHGLPAWSRVVEAYDLRLREGADLVVLTWALDAFVDMEGRGIRRDGPDSPPGESTIDAAWLLAVGAVVDRRTGRTLSVDELRVRQPRCKPREA